MDVGTAGQWVEQGVSRARLGTMVRHGELVRLRYGAYVTAAAIADAGDDAAKRHALDVRALLAVSAPGAVASHESAAIIHALPLLTGSPAGTVSLTQPQGGRHGTSRAGVRYHSARVPVAHVTTAHGAPVTTAGRTVIDLARMRPFMDGVVVADAAIRMLKTSRSQLIGVIKECGKSPGVDNARRVVDFSSGKSASPLESCARVVFDAYGLPPPEQQVTVHAGYQIDDSGRLRWMTEYHDYVVDFLWADRRTIAETDGRLKYKTGDDALRQNKRDTLLRARGYQVVHITWSDLLNYPELIIERILTAFGATTAY
jgi:very-short-patch-repair endonuclease